MIDFAVPTGHDSATNGPPSNYQLYRAPARMSETPSRDPRDSAMTVAAISSERTESDDNVWTRRLVLFLRIMAVLSVAKGLYHWAQVTGFVGGGEEAFENQPMAWEAAPGYFAGVEIGAAGGLWLGAPMGARAGVADGGSVGGIQIV